MPEPNEVLAAPFDIYLAAIDTAFPKVDAVPSGSWTLLGTAGSLNHDEAGITVEHNQTITEWRAAGSTAPRKAFRTEESLILKLLLVDLSPAMYAKVLNDATVTTTAPGTTQAGEKTFALSQGLTVTTFALLCRGLSSAGDAFAMQYECGTVYQGASPKPVYKKGVPAMLDCEFHVLDDDGTGFGTMRVQTAVHTG